MAVATFRETWVMFVLIGLLAFSMISFITVLQQQNNVENSILNDPIINRTFNKLEQNLSILENTTSQQRQGFESEIPERGFGSLIIFAIVGVTQKFTAFLVGIFNIIIILPASILGISPLVTSAIASILLVSLVLLGWRIYRLGE